MSGKQLTKPLRLLSVAWLRTWILVVVVAVLLGACTGSNADDQTRLSFVVRKPDACVWTIGEQVLVSTHPTSCKGPDPLPEADIDAEFPRWNKPGTAAAMVLKEDVAVVVVDGAEQGSTIEFGTVAFLVEDDPADQPFVHISTREELLPKCESPPCGIELRITRNGETRTVWLPVPTASEMGRPAGVEFNGLINFGSFEP